MTSGCMSDAPERITAYKEDCFGRECIKIATWEPKGLETYNGGTEYVRADIHAAVVAERYVLHEQVQDLLEDTPCACGHDKPTDICMKHFPMFRAITTERDALLVLVEMALELQETGFTDFQKYGLSCDEDISEKYRAALKGQTNE